MKVQINPQATEQIKSFKNVQFINKQDLEFQLSIVQLGLKYNRYLQMNIRSVKGFDKLDKKHTFLFDLSWSMGKILETFDFDSLNNRIQKYSITSETSPTPTAIN